MCKAPKAPKPPSATVQIDPGVIDEAAITARDRAKRRRAGMRGQASTILTQGIQMPQTASVKTATGQ